MLDVRRREFITLLGAARRPRGRWERVRSRQRMPVIGVLLPTSPDANAGRLRAFRQGLKDTGLYRGRERGDRIPLGGGAI
jgi:hypothetical protein